MILRKKNKRIYPALFCGASRQKNGAGFSLVEMLVIVSVVALLSSMAFASFGSARAKSRDSERISEMKRIVLALESCYSINKSYPASLDGSCGTGGADLSSFLNGIIPTDPINSGDHVYEYAPSDANDSYVVKAVLEKSNIVLDTDLDGTVYGVDCSDGALNFCKSG